MLINGPLPTAHHRAPGLGSRSASTKETVTIKAKTTKTTQRSLKEPPKGSKVFQRAPSMTKKNKQSGDKAQPKVLTRVAAPTRLLSDAQRLYAPPKRVASVTLKPSQPSAYQPMYRANSSVTGSAKAKAMKILLETSDPLGKPRKMEGAKADEGLTPNEPISTSTLEVKAETPATRTKTVLPPKKILYEKIEEFKGPKGTVDQKRQQVVYDVTSEANGGGLAATKKCGICGKGLSVGGSGICTVCMTQLHKNNVKVGTFEEFKVYANNVAHSVKKIIAIGDEKGGFKSDLQNGDFLQSLKNTIPHMIEESKKKSDGGVPNLHRNVTDLVPSRGGQNKDDFVRSSSFDIVNRTLGHNAALVPVACENAITFGSSANELFDDQSPETIRPCPDKAIALNPKRRETSVERMDGHRSPLAISFGNTTDNQSDDLKLVKKSKMFASSPPSHLKAIDYPKQKESATHITASKNTSLRAKTDIGFVKQSTKKHEAEMKAVTKQPRDKSSSVDPQMDTISSKLENLGSSPKGVRGRLNQVEKRRSTELMVPPTESSSESVAGSKKLIQTRSVTYSNMKAITSGAKAKSTKDGSLANNVKSKKSASGKSLPTMDIEKLQRPPSSATEEEEEEEEEGSDELGIQSKSAKFQTNKLDTTSGAILALEQHRKRHLRRAEKNRSLTDQARYNSSNQGKSVNDRGEYAMYKRSSHPAHALSVHSSMSSIVRSASLTEATEKPLHTAKDLYYGGEAPGRGGRFALIKSHSASQSDDESKYTYYGSYKIENSFQETDIDNGRYVYVSSQNEVKSGVVSANSKQMEKKPRDGFYTEAEVKKSQSDIGIGSALSRDLALGSGENPTLTGSNHYWEGSLGQVYQFAKDITAKASPNTSITSLPSKEEVFGGGALADTVYTGGFFNTNDFFYGNENPISSDSSHNSLYFDSESISLSSESSKNDIYTGDVFINTRNDSGKDSASPVSELETTAMKETSKNFVADGSANNSTRTARVSRRQRTRPPIDFLIEKSLDTAGDFFSKTFLGTLTSYNVSNNSNNKDDYFDSRGCYNEDTVVDNLRNDVQDRMGVKMSIPMESSYTEYLSRGKPMKEPEPSEWIQRPFDYSRYEGIDTAPPKFFFAGSEEPGKIYSDDRGREVRDGEMKRREESSLPSSPPYSSSALRKYEDDNNSNLWEAQNTNNNFPNYEEMYSPHGPSDAELEMKRMQDMERQRQQARETNSYSSGFFMRDPSQEARAQPYDSQPQPYQSAPQLYQNPPQLYQNPAAEVVAPTNMASSWGIMGPEIEPTPASYYSDRPSPYRLSDAKAVAPQPKQPVRPMLMKLGAITVRNNVENDSDYAANINMDLKGSPGAHPVPLEDPKNPQSSPVKVDIRSQEDSYSSVYSSDEIYSDTRPMIDDWRGDPRYALKPPTKPGPSPMGRKGTARPGSTANKQKSRLF